MQRAPLCKHCNGTEADHSDPACPGMSKSKRLANMGFWSKQVERLEDDLERARRELAIAVQHYRALS